MMFNMAIQVKGNKFYKGMFEGAVIYIKCCRVDVVIRSPSNFVYSMM